MGALHSSSRRRQTSTHAALCVHIWYWWTRSPHALTLASSVNRRRALLWCHLIAIVAAEPVLPGTMLFFSCFRHNLLLCFPPHGSAAPSSSAFLLALFCDRHLSSPTVLCSRSFIFRCACSPSYAEGRQRSPQEWIPTGCTLKNTQNTTKIASIVNSTTHLSPI